MTRVWKSATNQLNHIIQLPNKSLLWSVFVNTRSATNQLKHNFQFLKNSLFWNVFVNTQSVYIFMFIFSFVCSHFSKSVSIFRKKSCEVFPFTLLILQSLGFTYIETRAKSLPDGFIENVLSHPLRECSFLIGSLLFYIDKSTPNILMYTPSQWYITTILNINRRAVNMKYRTALDGHFECLFFFNLTWILLII